MWKLLRRVSLPLLLLINCYGLSAQNRLDSLKNVIDKTSDSTELKLLYKAIGQEFFDNEQDSDALGYFQKYLALSLKENDTLNILSGYSDVSQPLIYLERIPELVETAKKGYVYALKVDNYKYLAIFSNSVGAGYRQLGQTDSAIVYLKKALAASTEIENKHFESTILENIGNLYSNQGDYVEAINYFLKAQKIYKEIGRTDDLNDLENNLGILYKDIGEYDKSLTSYSIYLEHSIEKKDTSSIRLGYHNLASLFLIQNKLDTALILAKKSLSPGDQEASNCSTGDAILMGEIYLALDQYDSASYYFKRELALMDNCDSKFYYSQAKTALGDLALMENKVVEAKSQYLERYNYAVENNYLDNIADAARGLHQTYLKEGNYRQALTYYEQYKNTEDSIFNSENTRKIAWLEANQQMDYLADSLAFQQ